MSLQIDLAAQIRDRGLRPGDEGVEALAFRRGALLFRGDLMAERFLLLLEGCQFCGIDVLAVGGDLRCADP